MCMNIAGGCAPEDRIGAHPVNIKKNQQEDFSPPGETTD